MNTKIAFDTMSVEITHFINPSSFFCRDISLQNEDLAETNETEKKLAEYMKMNGPKIYEFYDPKKGDLVAYLYGSESVSKKWIRCVVDDYKDFVKEKVLILWAVDYGRPLYTTNLNSVFLLPHSFKNPRSKIFVAGLNVMPATLRFDHINCKTMTEFHMEWNDRAIKIFRETIDSAPEIFFARSVINSHPEVMVGDLLIFENSVVQFGMIAKLLKEEVAIRVPNVQFMDLYKKLFTNRIERWNDNGRTGGVLKNPEGFIQRASNNIQVLEPNEGDPKTPDSNYIQFSIFKVEEWMKVNNNFAVEPDDTSSDVLDESIPSGISQKEFDRITSVTSNNDISLPINQVKRDKVLRSTQTEDEQQNQNVSRKLIFLPAGASMNTNHKDPKYYKLQSKEPSIKESNFTEDNFVLASQVLNETTETESVTQKDDDDTQTLIGFESEVDDNTTIEHCLEEDVDISKIALTPSRASSRSSLFKSLKFPDLRKIHSAKAKSTFTFNSSITDDNFISVSQAGYNFSK